MNTTQHNKKAITKKQQHSHTKQTHTNHNEHKTTTANDKNKRNTYKPQ